MTSIANIPQYCCHMDATPDLSFSIFTLTEVVFDRFVFIVIIKYNTYKIMNVVRMATMKSKPV